MSTAFLRRHIVTLRGKRHKICHVFSGLADTARSMHIVNLHVMEIIMQTPAWATRDEINFLNGLGQWSESSALTKRQLLRNYVEASAHRNNWGAIDPVEIKQHCLYLLKQDTARGLR
jgi:hypothetical protein